MLPTLAGEFTLVADPELRFTPSGAAVSEVRLVAQNRRRLDDGTWEDDDNNILWINGSVWRQYAENVAESLRKGDKVFVTGKLRSRNYETREGEKRTAYEVNIDEIGPTLRFRQILHSDEHGNKVTREGAARSSTVDPDDPWATPAAPTEEPPF